MKKLHFIFCLIATLWIHDVNGQEIKIDDKDKKVPKSQIVRGKNMSAATFTPDGRIVICGGGGMDKLGFLVLDKNGTPQDSNSLEIPGLKTTTAMIHTSDGGFVVVGALQADKRNQRSFAAKLNEKGELLWLSISEISGDEQYMEVVQADGESVLIFIKSDGVTNLQKLNIWTGELMFTKPNKLCNWVITDAASNGKGQFGLTGYTAGRTSQAKFMEIDYDGKRTIAEKSVGKNTWTKGLAITYDGIRKQYAIAGEDKSLYRENIFLATVSTKNGRVVPVDDYGEASEVEVVADITQAANGHFYIGGYATEQGKHKKAYIVQTDERGKFIDEVRVNSVLDEQLFHLTFLDINRLTAIGSSLEHIFYDPLFLRTQPLSIAPPFKVEEGISVEDLSWVEQAPDDTLKAGERSFLQIKVRNDRPEPAFLKASVQVIQNAFGLYYYDDLKIGYIPSGETHTLYLPLIGEENLLSGETSLVIDIEDIAGNIVAKDNFKFITKRKPRAILEITPFSHILFKGKKIYNNSKEKGERGEALDFVIKIFNSGNAPSRPVRANFYLPLNVISLDAPNQQEVPSIAPGDTATCTFRFKAYSFYMADSISVRSAVKELDGVNSDYLDFTLRLPSIFEIRPKRGKSYIPDWDYEFRGKRGPYDPFFEDLANPCNDIKFTFETIKENEKDHRNATITQTDKIIIKIIVESKTALDSTDFLMLDGKGNVLQKCIDYNSCYPKIVQDTSTAKDTFRYYYFNILWLQDKTLTYQFKVKECLSTKFKIEYQPINIQIHACFIGIPYKDRSETVASAKYLYHAYANMNNQFFKKKHIQLVVETEELREKEKFAATISKTFKKVRAAQIENSKVHHIFLFYIASHLIEEEDGSYAIMNSPIKGYDPMDSPNVDLSKMIASANSILSDSELENQIHSYFIFETCFSGNAIKLFQEQQKGKSKGSFTIVTSAGSREKANISEEHKLPFMSKAFFEALDKKNRKEVDVYPDGLLTIEEIFQYVKKRMALLLEEYKDKGENIEQNPMYYKTPSSKPFIPYVFELDGAYGHVNSCGCK